MRATRRQMLQITSLGAMAAVGLSACDSKDSQPQRQPAPKVTSDHRRSLPIPPLAKFELKGDRLSTLLVAQTGTSEILPGVQTPTWGFNGNHLGPTIKVSRGDKVELKVRSTLPERTSVHWHGALVPAKADGGPHSPIDPGEEWAAQFEVDQPAATIWYHPHPHGKTGVQAYRGLAGMMIIEDEFSDRLSLPRNYGVDDIPVVLMDANINADGTLDETQDPDVGMLGDIIHVNGISDPVFEPSTKRVRLRLLDGSTMRFHRIGFQDQRPFLHIASDAGLFDVPREVTSVTLGPGERCEIVVECSPGEEVMLRSLGFEDNLGVPEDGFAPDFRLKESHDLLLLRAAQKLQDAPAPSAQLSKRPAPKLEGLIERHFELNGFQINGKSMDMDRVDLVIAHEQPEIWHVRNGNADWMHNFHIHDAAFQVLEVTGTEAAFDSEGWKDTVTLPPNAQAKLLVEFGQYTDANYPYMYHCHMLFHEDQGLMGQFIKMKPGEKAKIDTAYSRAKDDERSAHQH
ncbi:multicopper oxidase family protein [Corynebacterium gerontici]|uniref:multicopper oxidase family protein n=1 Tax=Corynebacterium gerontici TaxID=2079234 RepID=UPI000F4F29F4|nr:multicopper oxidase domain-containing protein [Corynebacterium gerontici]